jgi:hypothetical protein
MIPSKKLYINTHPVSRLEILDVELINLWIEGQKGMLSVRARCLATKSCVIETTKSEEVQLSKCEWDSR